jgi:hypothetical protein
MRSPNSDQSSEINVSAGGVSAWVGARDQYNRTCANISKAGTSYPRVSYVTDNGDGTFGSGLLSTTDVNAQNLICTYVGQHGNATAYGVVVRLEVKDASGAVLGSAEPVRADPERQYRVATRAPGAGSYVARCAPVSAKDTDGFPLSKLGSSCGGVTVDPTSPPEAVGIQELNPKTGAWDTVLDSPLPLEQRQLMEAYPDCYDGSQTCTLDLRAAQGTTTTACLTAGNGACAGWWADTAQGTQTTTATGVQYECSYGPYPVDLARCSVYRQAFEVGTKAGTITDPGGDPIPRGEGSTSPNSTVPVPVGGEGGSCMDTWMDDLNPIDWVLTPVKCALQWAFVPRPEVATEVQTRMKDAWTKTIVGRLPVVVADAVVIPDGGTGCSGPLVDIPIHFGSVNVDYSGYPLSACDEPMATLAGWARLIGSALLIWATGLGIIRRGSAVVNAPGVGGGS